MRPQGHPQQLSPGSSARLPRPSLLAVSWRPYPYQVSSITASFEVVTVTVTVFSLLPSSHASAHGKMTIFRRPVPTRAAPGALLPGSAAGDSWGGGWLRRGDHRRVGYPGVDGCVCRRAGRSGRGFLDRGGNRGGGRGSRGVGSLGCWRGGWRAVIDGPSRIARRAGGDGYRGLGRGPSLLAEALEDAVLADPGAGHRCCFHFPPRPPRSRWRSSWRVYGSK